eukprot:gene13519-13644_t
MVKIDAFFQRQSCVNKAQQQKSADAAGKPVPDASKRSNCLTGTADNSDLRLEADQLAFSGVRGPAAVLSSHNDQVGKIAAGNGAVQKPVPLAEATNKRQAVSYSQPAALPQSNTSKQPTPTPAASVVTRDLSSDSPMPGAVVKEDKVPERPAKSDLQLQHDPSTLSVSKTSITPPRHTRRPGMSHKPMDVDASPSPIAAVPAAAAKADAACGQHQESMTPGTTVVHALSDTPAAALDIMTTSTSKTLLPDGHLTADQRRQLLDDCMQEIPLLEAELDVRPCFSEAAAAAIANEAATSSKKSNQSGFDLKHQDVASRKSYGLLDGALANVDALEDDSGSYHWCWELRSFAGLPKPIKHQANTARKHRKQVVDRLKAASAFVTVAQAFTKSTKTAETKVARAAAKLNKLSSLQQLQQERAAAADAVQTAQVQQGAAAAASVTVKEAAIQHDNTKREEAAARKQRQVEAGKATKEAEKATKEAEKVAKAAAKAAEAEEKARLRAEREADAAHKREAKATEAAKKAAEAAKKRKAAEAAKKGFSSIDGLQKTQSAFKSFLGLAVKRSPPPAAGSDQQHSQGTGSQHEGACGVGNGNKEAWRVWAVAAAPSQEQVSLMQQLEGQLPSRSVAFGPAVQQILAELQQRLRGQRHARRRLRGLPPSWACRPAAAVDPLGFISSAATALYGEGVELSRLRCWRRKLIKHHDSVRPAFYGSSSRHSRHVSGRRPFERDVELDYEVMSDQDWEEEPEGESLSVDGDEPEDVDGDDNEESEGGFVVGDGYLSDDEGLRDDDEENQQMMPADGVAAAEAEVAAAASVGPGGSSDRSGLVQLEAGLERARARGRPVLLVQNCPGMTWEPTSNLDPSLLSSLKAHVHNSTLSMDKLVAQFVEAQASVGVKLAKARVKVMVKEISTMRMVSKAPLYTVKPERHGEEHSRRHPAAAAAERHQQDHEMSVLGDTLAAQQEEGAGQLRPASAAALGPGGPSGPSTSGGCQLPQLPDDGSAPGSTFWKQLAKWVVAVQQPSEADIAAAFAVFAEGTLGSCIDELPQVVLSAMVKTLGSARQTLPMRSACARCLANVVKSAPVEVGAPDALKAGGEDSSDEGLSCSAAAAAAALRARVASTNVWRGALKRGIKQTGDLHRTCYCCMALHALLTDPVACSQMIANDRLAKMMLRTAAARGAEPNSAWAARKWCLLVLSALMADSTLRSWALPEDKAVNALLMGAQEILESAVDLGHLLAASLSRPCKLGEPGADRLIVSTSLQLSAVLLDFLAHQQSLQHTLPGQLASILVARPQQEQTVQEPGDESQQQQQQQRDECRLVTALQELAGQTEWAEAAEEARQQLQRVGCWADDADGKDQMQV